MISDYKYVDQIENLATRRMLGGRLDSGKMQIKTFYTELWERLIRWLFTKKDPPEVSFPNPSLHYGAIEPERMVLKRNNLNWNTTYFARVFSEAIAWKELRFFVIS